MKNLLLRSTAAVTFVTIRTNIKDDQTRTRAEGTLAGGAIGALAGGIIGHQSGRGFEGALLGAGIGSLASV